MRTLNNTNPVAALTSICQQVVACLQPFHTSWRHLAPGVTNRCRARLVTPWSMAPVAEYAVAPSIHGLPEERRVMQTHASSMFHRNSAMFG